MLRNVAFQLRLMPPSLLRIQTVGYGCFPVGKLFLQYIVSRPRNHIMGRDLSDVRWFTSSFQSLSTFVSPSTTTTTTTSIVSIEAKEIDSWENRTNRLLNRAFYPVGFASVRPPADVAAWIFQVEKSLTVNQQFDQDMFHTITRCFRLLDRVAEEGIPVEGIISNNAIKIVLKRWKRVSLRNKDSTIPEELSLENVMENIFRYDSAGIIKEDPQNHIPFLLAFIAQSNKPYDAPIVADTLISSFNNRSGYEPDVNVVNFVLRLWRKSRRKDEILESAKRWLQRLQGPSLNQAPNAQTFAAIMSILRTYANPIQGAQWGEKFLSQQKVEGVEPNTCFYNDIIDVVVQAGKVERGILLLKELLQKRANAKSETIYDEIADRNVGNGPLLSILSGYEKQLERQPAVVVLKMETLLKEIEILVHENRNLESFQPTQEAYAMLMKAYIPLRDPQRVQSGLQYILKLHETRDRKMPLTLVWNGVLDALKKIGHPNTAQIVNETVKLMEEKSTTDLSCRPNIDTYNILLHCLANDSQHTISENALVTHKFVERMVRGEIGVKPNEDSYYIAISAWCKANCPENAEHILNRICCDAVGLGIKNDPSVVKPTVRLFSTIINGWASNFMKNTGQNQPLQRIEKLLNVMHDLHVSNDFDTKPTLASYQIFLNVVAQSPDPHAPERVESVLLSLEERARNDPSLQLDSHIYNCTLNAWLQSKRADALFRAESLFNKMKSLHSETKALINSFSYLLMSKVYAQKNYPEKVQELVNEIQHSKILNPGLNHYSTLLRAWSRAGNPEMASQVLQTILKEYKDKPFDKKEKSKLSLCNDVLNSWLRSGRPDAAVKAEEVLQTMLSKAHDFKGPDMLSFQTIIKAYKVSDHPERAQRALDLYHRMERLYQRNRNPELQPDLRFYVHLLEVLIDTKQSEVSSRQTLGILKPLLQQMQYSRFWSTQGDFIIKRLAICFTKESNLDEQDKAILMQFLWTQVQQYGLKLDRITTDIFKKYSKENTVQ